MQPGRRASLDGPSQGLQSFGRSTNGKYQQSNMDVWAQSSFMPPSGQMRGEYVIEKFTRDVANDPFIPSGIIEDATLENQRSQHILDTQTQQQDIPYSGALQHNSAIYGTHDDSGYGGSRVSGTIASPSISAGQEANGPHLQCELCDFKAKNRSDLRKHINRHTKPHKCNVAVCRKGFATANDLERHRRTVHWKECCSEKNATVYKCHHCEAQPGKLNKRRKPEWPRKDNFIAHLARVHNVSVSHGDDLEEYIVHSHQPRPEASPNISRGNNREAAQRTDLTGVGGTSIDIISSQTDGIYAKQLANLPSDPANAFTEQRIMKILQTTSDHLGRSSAFESNEPAQCISPDMLRRMNDGLLDSSLDGIEYRDLSFNFDHSHNAMDAAPQSDHFLRSLQYSSAVSNAVDINTFGTDDTGTDTCFPALLDYSNSTDVLIPESLEHFTRPGDPGTDHNALMDVLKRLQLPTPADSSASVTDHVRNLPQEARDLLVAALRASGSVGGRDDESISDADVTRKGQIVCRICDKGFKRPCELTKHLKRHSKPYGCTWRGCIKTFGSKNDWKRHETRQHYRLESWRCDLELCQKRSWNRRGTFKQHLISDHDLADSELMERKLEQCRRGTHCDPNFWCGFCVKYIDVDPEDGAGNSWTKRFDHIDNHFCGKDGMEQRSIDEWRHPVPEFSGGNDPFRVLQTHTPATNAFHKRTAEPTTLDSQPPVKRPNMGVESVTWNCCDCTAFMNIRTSPSCITCNHVRCAYCKITRDFLPFE